MLFEHKIGSLVKAALQMIQMLESPPIDFGNEQELEARAQAAVMAVDWAGINMYHARVAKGCGIPIPQYLAFADQY
jgi:hypothetical protein